MSAKRPPSETANLQHRITVKQAAKLMNVSERSIYMAAKICRIRPDLEPEVMAGRMSLHEAYRLVTNRPRATKFDKLLSAWRNASEDDQARFLAQTSALAPFRARG